MGLKFANSGQVCVSPNRCFVLNDYMKIRIQTEGVTSGGGAVYIDDIAIKPANE